jgi:serine O-acetyltransferase
MGISRLAVRPGADRFSYPRFGRNASMMSGAKVIGRCTVGDNVIFTANVYLKDTDIPACSMVFGSVPDLVIKPMDESYFARCGALADRPD